MEFHRAPTAYVRHDKRVLKYTPSKENEKLCVARLRKTYLWDLDLDLEKDLDWDLAKSMTAVELMET